MDNVVRKFFTNGKDNELIFNAYQGLDKNTPSKLIRKLSNNTNNYYPNTGTGINTSTFNLNEKTNNLYSNPFPNPNVIPNLFHSPEVKF